MAKLEFNEPLITRESNLLVDGLKVGQYRLQLRVFDDAGNVSRPDIVSIEVKTTRIGRMVTDTRINRANIVINNRLLGGRNR